MNVATTNSKKRVVSGQSCETSGHCRTLFGSPTSPFHVGPYRNDGAAALPTLLLLHTAPPHSTSTSKVAAGARPTRSSASAAAPASKRGSSSLALVSSAAELRDDLDSRLAPRDHRDDPREDRAGSRIGLAVGLCMGAVVGTAATLARLPRSCGPTSCRAGRRAAQERDGRSPRDADAARVATVRL
jgi:hypothetical protein